MGHKKRTRINENEHTQWKFRSIKLRATPYEVGLLLNFGPTPEYRRKVFDNQRKTATWQSLNHCFSVFSASIRVPLVQKWGNGGKENSDNELQQEQHRQHVSNGC